MLLLGRQLALRGIHCEYWFVWSSNRWPEFEATGRATLAPLSQLAARIERGEFDVVHLTSSDELALVVANIARHTRVVVTARGALAEGWDHTNCFAYTAISEGMAEVNQPYTDVRVEVVRNAIESERFSPPSHAVKTAPIVAFAGRASAPEKDFARFARVARLLVQDGVRIWIADPHDVSRSMFANETRDLPIERSGPVPYGEMPRFYQDVAASNGILLITSRTEGFGLVAPEAAACGARVAAPDIMGLREAVIDGVTGRLFAADASDESVAAFIRSWLREAHDPIACSESARSAFSPALHADKYIDIYSRHEQLTVDVVPPPKPFAEQPLLLAHLKRQRVWRSNASRKMAYDLAAAGYGDLSVEALMTAFRAAPGQFAHVGAFKQFSATLRHLAGRSFVRRVMRRMRNAGA